MRTETVYDILMKCTETANDYQEEFRRHVLGLTVLTDYNNKTYRINDIDFSKSPKKTFLCKEKDISFMDYYYQVFLKHTYPVMLLYCILNPILNRNTTYVFGTLINLY